MKDTLRILYAEDNPQDADLTRSHFAEFAPHLELHIAGTGKECLARLQAGAHDVLLLDFRLPDMEGLEVLKTLVAREIRIPTIMVTGLGNEELVVKALRLGASDYVAKQAGYLDTLPDILNAAFAEAHVGDGLGITSAASPWKSFRFTMCN